MTHTIWRFPALFVLGALFIQIAWTLSLPAFTGADEFDHAYRAAAVAGGEWRTDLSAPSGTHGDLVSVPESLPPAAAPICNWMPYTTRYNCAAVDDLGDGMVTVASGAARYNPAFYWVIGTVAKGTDGVPSLYVMRLASALLCALMLGLAAWAVGLWAKTIWPKMALVISMVPVAVSSLAVAAPNGLEFCAALSLWASLLGVARTKAAPHLQRRLIWSCLPGGLVLTTVRGLGPLWLALTVLIVIAVLGISQTRAIISSQRTAVSWVAALLTGGTLASVWWILSAGTTIDPTQDLGLSNPVGNSFKQMPLWVFQGFGAFPTRSEPAPLAVYLIGIPLTVGFCVLGWGAAGTRIRRALVLVLGLSVAVPLLSTMAVYSHSGAVWQGRYGLPLVVGLVLLVGVALEDRGYQLRWRVIVLGAAWVAFTTAQSVSVVHVVNKERSMNPFAETSHWLMPQPSLIALLSIAGCAAWGLAIVTKAVQKSPPPSVEGTDELVQHSHDPVSLTSAGNSRGIE
jgi:predicted membrane protein DUF2142